jgi:hypothetical protein
MAFSINFRTISATARLTQWNSAVLTIRQRVQAERTKYPLIIPERFIPVSINLPDGLNFQFNEPNARAQTTSATLCELTYNMSINTIYPHQMQIKRNGTPTNIVFVDNYNYDWNVSQFSGIMIAEQVRFSTLQDSLTNKDYPIYNEQGKSWRQYFDFFYMNFRGETGGGIYNNWSKMTSSSTSTVLQNGNRVNVSVPVMIRR